MNNKGFTLVESLLVLCLLGIVLSIVWITPSAQLQTSLEERIFFDQLKSELYYAQQYAVLHNEATSVYFDAEQATVQVETHEVRYIDLPSDWAIQRTFSFRYLPNGHVNYFRTVAFEHTPTGRQRKMVMQLGSGQFEIR